LLTARVSSSEVGSPDELPRYPIKNGDCSTYQGWARPAGWLIATEAGKHTLSVDPVPRQPVQRQSVAVVNSEAAGQGYVWQTVKLLEGAWRLRVEVAGSPDAKAQLEVARSVSRQSEPVAVTKEWKSLELDIPRVTGETGIHLRFYSLSGGIVKFRRVRLDAIRLKSEPVPIEGGDVLGGLVLAAKPTAAERFAAYELQRFVQQMTGKTPGIQGRDEVFDGRRIHIGTVAVDRDTSAKRKRVSRSPLATNTNTEQAAHSLALRACIGKLKGLPADAYLLHRGDSATTLAGNGGLSTLYAVYDFLNQQGCYWVTPGESGEVVPRRDALAAVKSRVVSPDFPLVRSFFTGFQQFFPGGGWIYIDLDDYRDWAVRNRFNSIWTGGPTLDLGADRGHGWIQNSGHSWNATIAPHGKYFAEHPEWYPLVKGNRMPRSDVSIRLPNQLCVSNQELRDYTVELILKYFRENPRSRMFPMSPMDGPNYNCECDNCRALDPPGYEWNQDFSDFPRFPKLKLPPLADRYLNYVNHVTERVAKVYPDRLIEFYNYASRVPPSRERVHPNVSVKFTYHSGREINVGLMDPHDPLAQKERGWLDAWAKSGTRFLTYYPYTDWEHPDAAIHWYADVSDLLGNLKTRYGCVGTMGETHTTVQADPMWWAIYARTLWDVDTNYRQVIRELCRAYYGAAASELTQFYLTMDAAVLHREGERPANYDPNKRLEFSLDEIQRGRELLGRAAEKVESDPLLLRRVDQARFAHALLTLVRTGSESNETKRSAEIRRKALNTANELRSKYTMMVRQSTLRMFEKQ
jgi:hypothetical protein